MGRIPVRAKLALDAETRAKLESIAKSRTDGQARIERAKVLLAKTILRGIRVTSKAELKARIMRYRQDLNADPVVFRWRYKIEEESVS